jgi:serine palmitoyltransferase
MPTFEPVGVAAAALEAAIVPEPRGARDFRLFDPLGYAMRPLSAAQHAIQTSMAIYGFGACGPRGFYGTTMPHLDLEAVIARYLGVEASIVYSAGVATASSVLPAIVQPGDHVIVDTKVHLGILTGLRLCKAEISWVPHGDIAAVEAALASKSAGKKKGAKPQQLRTFIIVEAINQRTGQVAPLLDLLALKDKHGALLLLDESVSLGSLGAHGRGLTEVCGVDASRVDGIIGSLEHALAGVGGFCAGRRSLVQHQRLAGAGFCFSAAGPPSSCSATQAILADLGAGGASSRLSDLQENSAALHSVMLRAVDGIDDMVLISSPESYVKHFASTGAAENVEQRLLAVAAQCRTAGVRVQVCSPDLCAAEAAIAARLRAPPSAAPTLRVCASAIQTASDIEALGEALQTAFDAVFRST